MPKLKQNTFLFPIVHTFFILSLLVSCVGKELAVEDITAENEGTSEESNPVNLQGEAFNKKVFVITKQSDGKILVGGAFTKHNNVSGINRLVRLNANGTLDDTFQTNIGIGPSDNVYAIKVQSDGKILVGGSFKKFNNISHKRFIRLNSDGTPDTTFNTQLGDAFNKVVNDIAIQSNGHIHIIGNFTKFNNVNYTRYVKLNSSGGVEI